MATRSKRVFFYLILALVCYGASFVAGGQAAFVAFLLVGAVGELMFWKELFFPAGS